MRAIVIEHEEDPPQLLGDWAREDGVELLRIRPDLGVPLPDPSAADFAVVLGSGASVADPDPWIAEELAWIREADRRDVPLLGVCFGAQALSVALGGTVRRLPAAEAGWIRIDSVEPAIASGPWLAYHHDHIVPPPNSRVLAANATGPQAYVLRRHLAVQFHPEARPATVAGWAAHYGRPDLAQSLADGSPAAARAAAQNARRLFRHAVRRALRPRPESIA